MTVEQMMWIAAGLALVGVGSAALILAIGAVVVGKSFAASRRMEAVHFVEPFADGPPDPSTMTAEQIQDAAKDSFNGGMTAAWAEEKAAEGWSPNDIQQFLDNRPIIELN